MKRINEEVMRQVNGGKCDKIFVGYACNVCGLRTYGPFARVSIISHVIAYHQKLGAYRKFNY